MEKRILAFDFGASSGRAMLSRFEGNQLKVEEIHRFSNDPVVLNGVLYWDIVRMMFEIKRSISLALAKGGFDAIGIDTWAVDFVLLDADNKRIGDAVAYRDERTEGIREALEKEYGLTFADHYARTGIQYQPFNTVYQLMALKKEHPEQLAAAKTFLMVPDYLNYLLCGVPANEYTNASTTALVGADSRDWDDALIEKLAKSRPNATIFLIGRTLPGVDLTNLKQYPNIVFHGLVPQPELPAYLAQMDVCLNVFRAGALSKDVSPLKFYEYLATGKPIVSTREPLQVEDFKDVVYIARNPEMFLPLCDAAAKEKRPAWTEKRLAYGAQCSWTERVHQMEEVLYKKGVLHESAEE